MRNLTLLVLILTFASTAIAGSKENGTTTLKDVQPVGTTDKQRKHLQYDLFFTSNSGKEYTCRTPENKKINPTDFVVGSQVTYELNGSKGKVKTSAGKQLECSVVRVAEGNPSPR
jgi:hypothetical protein